MDAAERENLKKLVLSMDKANRELALKINKELNILPALTEYATSLWQYWDEMKIYKGQVRYIGTTPFNMNFDEEDFDILLYQLEKPLSSIFPEYADWQAMKRLLEEYFDMTIYGGYRDTGF